MHCMPTQVYYSEIVNLIVIFVNKYNRLKATPVVLCGCAAPLARIGTNIPDDSLPGPRYTGRKFPTAHSAAYESTIIARAAVGASSLGNHGGHSVAAQQHNLEAPRPRLAGTACWRSRCTVGAGRRGRALLPHLAASSALSVRRRASLVAGVKRLGRAAAPHHHHRRCCRAAALLPG
jgi:hypothetical protein